MVMHATLSGRSRRHNSVLKAERLGLQRFSLQVWRDRDDQDLEPSEQVSLEEGLLAWQVGVERRGVCGYRRRHHHREDGEAITR